jgi:hypothetical protein
MLDRNVVASLETKVMAREPAWKRAIAYSITLQKVIDVPWTKEREDMLSKGEIPSYAAYDAILSSRDRTITLIGQGPLGEKWHVRLTDVPAHRFRGLYQGYQ